VERARREVAEADAIRAAEAAAEAAELEAEARRTEEEDELQAARKRRRERWTNGARRSGNVAASVGIVALAVFGADRIFQLPDAASRVPSPAVPVPQPAEARPPEATSDDSTVIDVTAGSPERDPLEPGTRPLVVLGPDFESGVPGVVDPEVVPAGVDPRIFALDALADSADGAMVYFGSMAAAFEAGAKGCEELKAAYVEVDSRWAAYVVNGVSRMEADLDEERSERHRALSRAAQRIEVSYEVTGCPIP
jgi:hypothetical protein